MFSLFESSFLLFIPVGYFLLLGLVWFLLYGNSYGFDYSLISLYNHFTTIIYPSAILIMVMFFMILLLNLLGLVPMSFSYTSLPMLTLGMGVLFWGSGYIYCLLNNYSHVIAHFLPLSAPVALWVALVLIEILSWLCRPLALSIRLMANITAGHLLLLLISSGVYAIGLMSMVLLVVLLMLVFLEMAVAVIQSYVYNLLLSLYMSESL